MLVQTTRQVLGNHRRKCQIRDAIRCGLAFASLGGARRAFARIPRNFKAPCLRDRVIRRHFCAGPLLPGRDESVEGKGPSPFRWYRIGFCYWSDSIKFR